MMCWQHAEIIVIGNNAPEFLPISLANCGRSNWSSILSASKPLNRRMETYHGICW